MEENILLPVEEKINTEYSKDKMFGIVYFESPQNGGGVLSEERIRAEIARKGIKQGIDEEMLKEISKNRQYDYKYVIAKGAMPQKGKDAEIKFLFDIESIGQLKPKENTDGTVDFKELNAAFNVKKGQELAVKTNAEEGINGYNVLGDVLKAQKGKDVRLPKGKNTEISKDGLTIIASIDGQLFYDKHNLYISPNFIVEKDLDSSVGNIDFIGNVIVNGNVNSGFTIKAGGNVEVKGNVEAAHIIADGDIILWYGIQGGERGELSAKGNIVAKFIQNSKVFAQRDIVTEAIMHSEASANGKVLVDKGKGMIVGGTVMAGSYMSANIIGSPMATATAIQIGIPPQALKEYKELEEAYATKKEDLDKTEKAILFLSGKSSKGQLTQDKLQMLGNLRQTRTALMEEVTQLGNRYKELSVTMKEGSKGIIKVKDVLHSSVKITIGTTVKYIKERTEFCSVQKVGADIVIGSY